MLYPTANVLTVNNPEHHRQLIRQLQYVVYMCNFMIMP